MDEPLPDRRRRRGPLCLPGLLLLAPALLACEDATSPVYTFWEASLLPIRPSLVGGRLVAVTQAGRTSAGIQIEDAEPEVVYGWRIETGTCDAPGVTQGGPGLYPSLVAGQSGTASAETSLSELFRSGKQFAGRVFRTGDGGGEQIVACGNLEETDG